MKYFIVNRALHKDLLSLVCTDTMKNYEKQQAIRENQRETQRNTKKEKVTEKCKDKKR